MIAPLDLSGPKPNVQQLAPTFGVGDTVALVEGDGYLEAGAQGQVIWAGVKGTCWEGIYRVVWEDESTSRHYLRELRFVKRRTADFDRIGVNPDGRMTLSDHKVSLKYEDGKYDPVTGEAVVA